MNYNTELMALAEWRLQQLQDAESTEKTAFIPPGGGQPPPGGDPSGGGGGAPPPGGGDPMAAAMGGGGGMPPPGGDPMAGGPGGAPPVPGGGGMTADTISQIVSQVTQQMQGGGGMGGAGGGMGGAGGGMGKPAKPDLNTVAMDIFQVKKMLQHMFNTMGIEMPPDIIDGPNRDPRTGMPMAPGAPGSTSDPAMMSQGGQQGGQGGVGAGGAASAAGAIPPIQPMQAAGPGGGSTGGDPSKQADHYVPRMGRSYPSFDINIPTKAAALASLYKRLQG